MGLYKEKTYFTIFVHSTLYFELNTLVYRQIKKKIIKRRVPQGSVLGPLLCLLCINNIHEAGLQGNAVFVDDTIIINRDITKAA